MTQSVSPNKPTVSSLKLSKENVKRIDSGQQPTLSIPILGAKTHINLPLDKYLSLLKTN